MNKTVHKFSLEDPVIDVPSLVTFIHNTYGVSYRYIAEVLGISNTHLSYLRRGVRQPSSKVIRQIFSVLLSQDHEYTLELKNADPFFATSMRGTTVVAKDLTIQEALYDFLIAKQAEGKSDDTITFYRENLARFIWWLRVFHECSLIADITVQVLRAFYVYVGTAENRWEKGSTSSRKKASRSTIDAYWRTLQSFFTWLVNEEIIENDRNPMKKIPRPKVTSKIIKDIPLEVIRKVMDYCGHDPFTLARNRAIIMVFLDTGVRLGGCTNIKLTDIDFDTGLITVIEKGDKPNLVHLGETAMSTVFAYLEVRKKIANEYLWVNQNGKRMQKSGIQTMIRRLRKYGGDEYRWTPHTFRNTWAINLLRGGADTFSLQVLGGWVDLEMPRRYTRAMNIEDAVRVHKMASPADRMAQQQRSD